MKTKPRNTHTTTNLWLYGHHAVEAAANNPKRVLHKLITTHDASALLEKVPRLNKVSHRLVDAKEMQGYVGRDVVHQGVALLVDPLPSLGLEQFPLDKPHGLILVLDQVTDPHNLGAIIRTAHAFQADALILPQDNTPPLHGIVAKTACGALDLLPIIHVVNLARALEYLKKNNFWVVGMAEQADRSLAACNLTGKMVIAMGAEGTGLRRLTRDHCDFLAKVPTNPDFPSLNVSVATAITLYEASRQRTLKE